MSASGEDIREDIRLVACGVLKDDQTNVDRNIVIFEYTLPPPLVPMRSAFYQSSGTSLTTNDILRGTYFPFYGSTVSPLNEMQNTLIKATQHTQSGSLSPELQLWKTILPQYREYDYEIVKTFDIDKIQSRDFGFISARDEIFKRFTHFYELKISALIGSEWWSRGGTTQIIKKFVLSHVWNGEQFIDVGSPRQTLNEMIEECFKQNEHELHDVNEEINKFLSDNHVNNVIDTSFQDIKLTHGHKHNTRGTPNKIFHSHRIRAKLLDPSKKIQSKSPAMTPVIKRRIGVGLLDKRVNTMSSRKKATRHTIVSPLASRSMTIEPRRANSAMSQKFSVNINDKTIGGANTRKKGRNNKNKNKTKRRKRSSSRRRRRHRFH